MQGKPEELLAFLDVHRALWLVVLSSPFAFSHPSSVMPFYSLLCFSLAPTKSVGAYSYNTSYTCFVLIMWETSVLPCVIIPLGRGLVSLLSTGTQQTVWLVSVWLTGRCGSESNSSGSSVGF